MESDDSIGYILAEKYNAFAYYNLITVLITVGVFHLQVVGLQSKDIALVSPSYNGKKLSKNQPLFSAVNGSSSLAGKTNES